MKIMWNAQGREYSLASAAEQQHDVNSAGHTVADGSQKTRGLSVLFCPVLFR